MRVSFAPYPNIAPTSSESILVEIDARIVPVLLSAAERYKFRTYWASDEDWKYGVQALNTLQESLLTGTQSIVDAIDRVYRLLDTSLNGIAYTATPDAIDPDILIVTPELPAAPADLSPALLPAHALRKRLERLIAGIDGGADLLTDNLLVALRGNVTAGDDRNVIDSQSTVDLVEMLDDIEPLLINILVALA